MTTAAAEPARAEASPLRPMILAMGKTGGASIASGLLSALGTKIVAMLLGPGSVALLQTLQQLRDGALNLATANGRTGLVQGASALEGVERREYLRTVALLFAGGTLLVAAAMVADPGDVARWSRLPESSEAMLPWLAATVALLSIFVFLAAILNALREIGKLALLQLASPLVAAMVAWPLAVKVRAGHPAALILFLALPAAATATAAALALRRHRDQLREWFEGPGRCWSGVAASGFLSISGAMLASSLAATAVLLAVRGSITRHEGLAMTGQFDAAWNISMNQVTLILASVQAYYLPTLAAAKSAGERGRQIRTMLIVATLSTVPVIVTLVSLKPLAVSFFYSHAFTFSPGFLRWTLVGDYLKVSSWVLATPMLATRDVGAFLGLDLLTQGIFFVAAMLLARIVKSAESAAIGFLLSYACYFAVCYAYARARHGFRFGAAGLAAWLTGLGLIICASANAWSDSTVHVARAAVWMLVAAGFSAGFAIYLRRREQ
jgi:O-antigen/teichoic acid export membrane protein